MEKLSYPTPHIDANPDQIAQTVLMPGDPLRAKFVAENFLQDAVLFNNVRGVQGYTGTYRGTRVSVMASGMGMPSIGIYSYELYSAFGVENIIRIGSAGAMRPDVHLRDLVLGMGACTDSNFAGHYGLGGTFAPICDFSMLQTAVRLAEEKGLSYHVGNLLSTDVFYGESEDFTHRWGDMGVLAVEMEAAALYMNAAKLHKRALTVCTVSDSLVTGEAMDAISRQESLTDMITLCLDVAVEMETKK